VKTLSLFNVPPPVAAPEPTEDVDLDDYDDAQHAHAVDPTLPAPSVLVEAVGDGFEVARMRDDGTTVACVIYTRAELVKLMSRCQAALGGRNSAVVRFEAAQEMYAPMGGDGERHPELGIISREQFLALLDLPDIEKVP
jgi:hypothetical protein